MVRQETGEREENREGRSNATKSSPRRLGVNRDQGSSLSHFFGDESG